MRKWNYKMIFVPIEDEGWTGDKIGKIGSYIDNLGNKGWELVSVASQIGDINPEQGPSISKATNTLMAGGRVTNMTQHQAGTTGYLFVFKKRIID